MSGYMSRCMSVCMSVNLIVAMKTVRLRRLRVVILVTCLILVSSVGYWFMYVTSQPRSELSTLHNSMNNNPRNSHRHREKSASDGRLSEHGPGLGEKDDGYAQNKWRNSYQQKEATNIHVDSKQQLKEESHRARLAAKDDDKYDDYSDDEGDTVDGALPPVKNAVAAAGVPVRRDDPGRLDEREGNELPAADDDDDDVDYGFHGNNDNNDVKNIPKKVDEKDSVDNKEEVPGINRDDYHSVNRQRSRAIHRNEEIGDVRGDSVLYRGMIDDDVGPRRKQDGGVEEPVSSREEMELDEVKLDRVDTAQRMKSDRDMLRERTDEAWRLQQANDGARASHLRSHNIAPIPRVYVSAALDRGEVQELAVTTGRVSELDEVVNNIDVETSHRAIDRDSTSSSYFIVHSGLASKVNAALHPNLRTLPDHVLPEAYIFTSNRSLFIRIIIIIT